MSHVFFNSTVPVGQFQLYLFQTGDNKELRANFKELD